MQLLGEQGMAIEHRNAGQGERIRQLAIRNDRGNLVRLHLERSHEYRGMFGDRGAGGEIVAVRIRLEYGIDSQQVVSQEESLVKRFFSGCSDVGPESQQFLNW